MVTYLPSNWRRTIVYFYSKMSYKCLKIMPWNTIERHLKARERSKISWERYNLLHYKRLTGWKILYAVRLKNMLRVWIKIRAIKTQKVEILGTSKRIFILRIQNCAQPSSWINGKCCNTQLKTIADGKQEKA